MNDFLQINRRAYNELADEYQKRWQQHLEHQKTVLAPFAEELRKRFTEPIQVLDVGCGVGLDAYILSDHGFKVTGIDFAEKMIEHARTNVPKASFIVGNFLTTKFPTPFEGMIMTASFHLFPEAEISLVAEKMRQTLDERGIIILSTTKSGETREGYFEKTEYGLPVKHFRRYWKFEDLNRFLRSEGFSPLTIYEDRDIFGRDWVNFLLERGREAA